MFCIDLSSGAFSLGILSPPEYRRAREKQVLLRLNQDSNNYLQSLLIVLCSKRTKVHSTDKKC